MSNFEKILIVEDDELVASLYKRHFEAAGFEVLVETDGVEGYYQIFKQQPDAVLLDLLLPGMDGPSIIRKFRAQPKFANLPIIAFTNAFLSDIKRQAVSAGATQVFDKAAVAPHEIVLAVVNALTIDTEISTTQTPLQMESSDEDSRLDFMGEPPFHACSYTAPTTAQRVSAAQGATALTHTHNAFEKQARVPDGVAAEVDNIVVFQAAVQQEFLRKSDICVSDLRNTLGLLKVKEGQRPKPEVFLAMAQGAHTISENAAIVGLHHLAHLASALEALAQDLFKCPAEFSVATRLTLAKGIDMIARLVTCGSSCKLKEFGQFHVLVVDDDALARVLIGRSLDHAKLSHVATGNPEIALELSRENKFDLVILDVTMDGMSGFELCKALRKLNHYLHSPVIFVSSLSDFHSKVVSLQSGGNDFIVKPFAPAELALKSLLHMLGSQLAPETSGEKIKPEESGSKKSGEIEPQGQLLNGK